MRRDYVKLIPSAVAMVLVAAAGFGLAVLLERCRAGGPEIQTGVPVLEAIQHVNKEIFIEHYLVVDVSYTRAPEGPWKWLSNLGIKQDFLLLIRGRVPAGFDLQQVTEQQIWTSADGTRVQLTLPAPTVFVGNVSIDFENSKVLACLDTCPNMICGDKLTAYQTQALPAARDTLIEHAVRYGILEQAAQDGKAYYEQFLKSLGFQEVKVIVTGYTF